MAANGRRSTVDDLRADHSAVDVLVWLVDSAAGTVQEGEPAVRATLRPG